jgi:hypothetical protein
MVNSYTKSIDRQLTSYKSTATNSSFLPLQSIMGDTLFRTVQKAYSTDR